MAGTKKRQDLTRRPDPSVTSSTAESPGSSPRARAQRDFDPRSIAGPGERFGELQPELAARAIGCLRYPKLDLGLVKLGSNLYGTWICLCGVSFARKVLDIVKQGTVRCGDCRDVGKSRLDFEVAELLRGHS